MRLASDSFNVTYATIASARNAGVARSQHDPSPVRSQWPHLHRLQRGASPLDLSSGQLSRALEAPWPIRPKMTAVYTAGVGNKFRRHCANKISAYLLPPVA
eukprot:6149102-Amphidinium_carterae.2